MFSSIRTRLTAWYVGILFLVLAVFGVCVYFMTADRLYRTLDRRLAGVAHVMASSLEHEIEEHQGQAAGETMFRGVLSTVHQETFPDSAIAVCENGRIVARKVAADGKDALTSNADCRARDGYTSQSGWRVFHRSAWIHAASLRYFFVVAQRDQEVAVELLWLRRAMILAIPLALVFAAAGGWWMARKSLAPVVAMSATVDRITASSLNQRVSTPNPHDELGFLGATFNRLLDRLQRAFEQQRQFMADAAHELRTPVSIARTASQLAIEAPHRPESEYREALGTIENQMRRLSRLVQDMFLLARADSGALPLQPEPLYLDELVREVVKDATLLARRKSLVLSARGLTETPYRGDDALLRRLLLVLLDNAVKHTPEHGEIVVQLETAPSAVRIVVRDGGRGIQPADVPHIFERFYRAEKSRTRQAGEESGAGLGLAIGRTIAEAHGGTLHLLSTGPHGSAFEILLPLSKAGATSEAYGNTSAPAILS